MAGDGYHPLEILLYEEAERRVQEEMMREAGVTTLEAKGFYLLCAEGAAPQIAEALAGGADPRVLDETRGGATALHDAAAHNPDPEVVRLLRKAGADPNVQGRMMGRTPLHMAVLFNPNPGPVIRALAESGANLDLPDKEHMSPLQTAIRGRVNVRNNSYVGPDDAIVLALVESGADCNRGLGRGYTALGAYLCEIDRATDGSDGRRVVQAMVAGGAKLNALTPAVCGKGDMPILFLAMDLDSPILGGKTTALTEILLRGGADPLIRDDRGRTAAHFAAWQGNAALLRLVLRAAKSAALHAAVDEQGDTPLHEAAGFFLADTAKCAGVLLQAGANVNAQNKYGQTALHVLAEDTAHRYDQMASSPFDDADRIRELRQRMDLLDVLFAHKAAFLPDSSGRTPLHVLWGRMGFPQAETSVCLKAGANINAKDHNGDTPMLVYLQKLAELRPSKGEHGLDHYEQRRNLPYLTLMTEALTFLLQNGADPTLRNNAGKKATDLLTPDMREVLEPAPVYKRLTK